MSPDVEVRDAGVGDVEAVVDVAEAAWYAAYGGFLDPATVRQGLEENYDPELVAAAVEHENVAFFVAEADGEVIGFASAEQTWADEVELHTVYVHPDRWGEGTGSALLERVEAWARDRGVDRIACAVFTENAIGTGFFEATDFRRGTEAQAEIAGERHPEIEFELPL